MLKPTPPAVTPGAPAGLGDTPRGAYSYPPLMGRTDGVMPDLPTPRAYFENTPGVLGPPPVDAKTQGFNRKRVIIGVFVAAGLHAALVLGWWLTPPLRLKAGYAPDRWVPILAVPSPAPINLSPPVPAVAHPAAGSSRAEPSASRSARARHRSRGEPPR